MGFAALAAVCADIVAGESGVAQVTSRMTTQAPRTRSRVRGVGM
jgi:hypothetical protein